MKRNLHLGRGDTGFTLIEVMVVVAILAILSSVAIPSYRDYVKRGNVPEATSRLASKQVQMEQWFQDNRTYVGGAACSNDTTASKYFDFSCSGVTATGFTMTAAGKASMAGFTYTIDQAGAKTSTFTAATGWSAPSPNNCWAIRKSGQC